MFKKRMWIGIILSIILLIFSINGFTTYYKYTQESGTNFYVGIDDKADALEDTNEVRQILDDLGDLLGHSLKNNLYPKNGDTGGYLGRLNYGLDASKPAAPAVNDMYLATDTTKIYKCFVAEDWVQIYPEGGVTTFLGLTDTPGDYIDYEYEILRVNGAHTAVEFSGVAIETTLTVDSDAKVPTSKAVNDFCETTQGYLTSESDPNVDTDAEIKAILVDEVTKTGSFIAGRNAVIQDTSGIISQGTNTNTEIATAVTRSHIRNEDTKIQFYNVLANNHDYSGLEDIQPVGESVVFGDLLYFDWGHGEWLKTDANSAAKVPGLRIALESKIDGQACKMLVMGYIRDDTWNFTASMVYASVTPGTISSTAPTETGDQVQRVGVAKSADILFFDPSIDVGEI